jgi:hypothetical protein
MFKADVFIAGDDAWSREQMARALAQRIDVAGTPATIRFASPEDVVLQKLVWYKLGDEISERQWHDVLGVLRIQTMLLDTAYLERWGQALDIGHLLARATAESRATN